MMQSLTNKPYVFAMGMLVGAAADFAWMRTSTEPEKAGTHESVAKESAAQQPSAGSDARSADLLGALMSPSERSDIMEAVRQVAKEEVGSHIQAFAQGAAKRATEQSEIIAAAREVAKKEAQTYIKSVEPKAIKAEDLNRPGEETKEQRYEKEFQARVEKTELHEWQQRWESARQLMLEQKRYEVEPQRPRSQWRGLYTIDTEEESY
jgi:hypothetical protein